MVLSVEADMRSLSQERAAFALQKVQDILHDNNDLNKDNFKSFVAGVPTMILQNGFGQALAFWAAKAKMNDKSKEGYTLKIIREWFNDEKNPLQLKSSDTKSFIDTLISKNQRDFLQYQQEALAMLEWFKRFANAFLSEEKKAESEN
jgi:CRISPR-associated protein Cmr5